jgi:hypothetical protein
MNLFKVRTIVIQEILILLLYREIFLEIAYIIII